MSSTSPLEVCEEVSIFEQSSPESLRARPLSPLPNTHDLQSSTSEEQTLNTDIDDSFSHHKLKHYSSNRSSISSLPASIIHNTLLSEYEDGHRIPSKPLDRSDSPGSRLNVPGYMHGFRNPSSVRALQLGESEYTDTDTLSVSKGYRQRKVPKISYFSPRSPGSTQSSPTKRSSRPGTPQQRSSSKLKKEFPLVLLHCTLLPPATRVPQISNELYEAVLPEEYKKRWRTLQDKVARNAEVRQRGVLIPHPHDDYELLEEKLLESLELERPRIRQHHYLASKNVDGADSGFESSSQTDEGSDVELELKEKCPDCGKCVSVQTDQERKWQIKVYAANGLMKAGAWAAAWQEMEKVDVEVGVWMPEDVRIEVDERLTSLQAQQEAERPVTDSPPLQPSHRPRSKSARARLRHDERMKEIYGDSGRSRTQAEIDGLADNNPTTQSGGLEPTEDILGEAQESPDKRPHVTFAPEPTHFTNRNQPDALSLIQYRFNSILQDQKNLAILLLSLLVLFFAIQTTSKPVKALNPVVVEQEHHRHAIPSLPSISSSQSQAYEHEHEYTFQSTEDPVVSYITTTVFAPMPASTDAQVEPAPAINAEDGAVMTSEDIEIEMTSEDEPLSDLTQEVSAPFPHETTVLDTSTDINELEETASASGSASNLINEYEDNGGTTTLTEGEGGSSLLPQSSARPVDEQQQSSLALNIENETEPETEVADNVEAKVVLLQHSERDLEDMTNDDGNDDNGGT